VNACEIKPRLIGLLTKLGAVCFWQPTPSVLNLTVAVLRDKCRAVIAALRGRLKYIVCL